MARRRIPIYLNIRQKIIVGLSICIVAVGLIGYISNHYLREIERKVRFVQIADDLKNTVLEIRRYEKNYFLYGLTEDVEENRRYIGQGFKILDTIAPDLKSLKGVHHLRVFKSELLQYKEAIDTLVKYTTEGTDSDVHRLQEDVRSIGKVLVETSQALMNFERKEILSITRVLKTRLLTAFIVFFLLGAFLIPFVAKNIIRPLQVIEKTTLRIAEGKFKTLPVLKTRDETQRVVEAFNTMVKELEKRQHQLVESKKLSSLGTLTSGVAHQLNNPLNNISTSCQILLEELPQADPEFLEKMLHNIEQEGNRARDIVKGLLEFSREREFALKPTPLKEVVERSLKLISSQVPAGVDIVTEVSDNIIVCMDFQKMQEALLNLLINATQSIESPPGEIRITGKIDPSRQEAILTVEDTGVGIPREVLHNVFDPFFTTKEVGIGTGLGLSIVYGIIQKHNGTISVESKKGEGTRFIIRLPLKQK